ncbi:uncharacterized protein ASPGLDRAFT_30819 [Aspergillus glaucus CBS 516.65]|uniref:Uncharacterized protein n=1 Tax=Aspergillus glaucus CBS 516.65 TaxID=1160497 RepID=A0A1L9VYV9_ASPGL|nr:hypothetical protein ASPGLDRAFT_30819 [Aspergillus glaucus CBS 516.65]OJJ89091.1 hypothetical protein ASPGLDRAFT_30819 [Aspergillus glaucus CBS 516.65]
MRIYLQIPYTGTDSQSLDDLAQQSATYTPIELEALQAMTEEGFSIIPQLLSWGFALVVKRAQLCFGNCHEVNEMTLEMPSRLDLTTGSDFVIAN